jgi:probable HAF family extracellular repeat protein
MKSIAVLFGWFSVCLLLPTLAFSQSYTVSDVGTLGGPSSWAYGVNDFGHVVGYACVDVDCNTLHAFEWSRTRGIRDLGTFMGGGSYSIATGINDFGQISGASDFSQPFEGNTYASLWGKHTTTLENLGSLGCPDVNSANGIGFSGQVVGTSTVAPCGGGGLDRAFVWTHDHGMQDLGTLAGGTFSFGNGVNFYGQAVGYSDCESCASYHAFLWTGPAGMKDLGTLHGGTQSSAQGVNDFGTVVGTSELGVAGLPLRAFAWTRQSHMRNLGTLPGGAWSSANAVSDLGQIVGISDAAVCASHKVSRLRNGKATSDASHAFTWNDFAGMRDLNDLIPKKSGWVLTSAESVNNLGQIVGWGTLHGETRAFLLTPVCRGQRGKQ